MKSLGKFLTSILLCEETFNGFNILLDLGRLFVLGVFLSIWYVLNAPIEYLTVRVCPKNWSKFWIDLNSYYLNTPLYTYLKSQSEKVSVMCRYGRDNRQQNICQLFLASTLQMNLTLQNIAIFLHYKWNWASLLAPKSESMISITGYRRFSDLLY